MNIHKQTLLDVADRIRTLWNTGHAYTEENCGKTKFDMLVGGLDSITDCHSALSAVETIVLEKRPEAQLICYGFLQALVIEQDAVAVLAKAVNFDWKPISDPELFEIREKRNRVCGHPSFAERQNPPSSSFINRYDITNHGFSAVVYRNDVPYSDRIDVNFKRDRETNANALLSPLKKIEQKIRDDEAALAGA